VTVSDKESNIHASKTNKGDTMKLKVYKSLKNKTFIMATSITQGRISIICNQGEFFFVSTKGIQVFKSLKEAVHAAEIA